MSTQTETVPGWKKHGRAGPLDWWIGCRSHNTASGEFEERCPSCRIAAKHNAELKEQLEREKEFNR